MDNQDDLNLNNRIINDNDLNLNFKSNIINCIFSEEFNYIIKKIQMETKDIENNDEKELEIFIKYYYELYLLTKNIKHKEIMKITDIKDILECKNCSDDVINHIITSKDIIINKKYTIDCDNFLDTDNEYESELDNEKEIFNNFNINNENNKDDVIRINIDNLNINSNKIIYNNNKDNKDNKDNINTFNNIEETKSKKIIKKKNINKNKNYVFKINSILENINIDLKLKNMIKNKSSEYYFMFKKFGVENVKNFLYKMKKEQFTIGSKRLYLYYLRLLSYYFDDNLDEIYDNILALNSNILKIHLRNSINFYNKSNNIDYYLDLKIKKKSKNNKILENNINKINTKNNIIKSKSRLVLTGKCISSEEENEEEKNDIIEIDNSDYDKKYILFASEIDILSEIELKEDIKTKLGLYICLLKIFRDICFNVHDIIKLNINNITDFILEKENYNVDISLEKSNKINQGILTSCSVKLIKKYIYNGEIFGLINLNNFNQMNILGNLQKKFKNSLPKEFFILKNFDINDFKIMFVSFFLNKYGLNYTKKITGHKNPILLLKDYTDYYKIKKKLNEDLEDNFNINNFNITSIQYTYEDLKIFSKKKTDLYNIGEKYMKKIIFTSKNLSNNDSIELIN